MTGVRCAYKRRHGGILLRGEKSAQTSVAIRRFLDLLVDFDLAQHLKITTELVSQGKACRFSFDDAFLQHAVPGDDTLGLARRLGLDPAASRNDMLREVVAAMLASPDCFEFPSFEELMATVRVRGNIVENGSRTSLAFHTEVADRPPGYWNYAEDRGFTLKPGKCIVEALTEATQPDVSGRLYPFSCYRATEYVILLGVAQELRQVNPMLFRRLQQQWETRAITSDRFRSVFLREYGSMNVPLPTRYYVPGDRVWFRNPDDHSSDATGFEGSWVFYLGNGQFTNFWKRNRPFTLESKCIELYHWRHATYRDDAGELQIDESVVDARVRESMADPTRVEAILKEMLRLREPSGVYVDGGCIDTSREYPRRVCPGTSDMELPDVIEA